MALGFPQAVQIVDWYHAVEYLTRIASALYTDEQEAEAWRERMVTNKARAAWLSSEAEWDSVTRPPPVSASLTRF